MNAAEKNEALHTVYISLGSNITPKENLLQAVALLSQTVDIQRISTVWETPAVGFPGPNFFNAAVHLLTHLSVKDLKYGTLRGIESSLGRVRTKDKFAPRTIDLDILIFDDLLVESNIWKQAFYAIPLAELLPDLQNPSDGESLAHAAHRLANDIEVRPRYEVLLESMILSDRNSSNPSHNKTKE